MASKTKELAGPMSKASACGIGKGTTCVCDTLSTLDAVLEGFGTMSRDALDTCMCEAITSLDCCATLALATPLDADALVRFKAISVEFANLTEYASPELLSSQLRVLKADDFLCADFEDDAKLRSAVLSGRPCTALRVYQKSSGQLLRVLLHLQGLRVAIPLDDTSSSRGHGLDNSVWYLLGVYEDVSELSDDETSERIEEVKGIVNDVRKKIAIALECSEANVLEDGNGVEKSVLAIDPEWIC
eukprot:TRINITY_DN19953_c1_g2_i1.p1 TRINITY_DN19953_c1_g2~~TRINITY_DN19953_c1_g2_i1.p1  ORF type:complete len:244 (+),score=42.09 TRINITY_DN19953_c1_g2_i1:50-781(+)